MAWLFALLGLVLIVVIGLVLVGRETARLAVSARPAVFDLAEAVEFIADRLPPAVQARLSHDDVRWILLADADLLEHASNEPEPGPWPWSRRPAPVAGRPLDAVPAGDASGEGTEEGLVVDEDVAVARILRLADESDRDLADEDIAAVLDVNLRYLEAIGAIGGEA